MPQGNDIHSAIPTPGIKMLLSTENPWITEPNFSGSVSLSTDTFLWASVSGPIRLPNAPLLIFFTGGAASCAIYVQLQEQLSKHVRVLFYDRAGYDLSTLPPKKSPEVEKDIFAQDTARDLFELLSITDLGPPYILMGHSYGGIPARCFLSLNPSMVTGMVLLDTATEMLLAMHKRLPPYEFEAVAHNVDYEAITNLKEESAMTDEQWDYAMEAQTRTIEQFGREDTHASATKLAHEHQFEERVLGSTPLTVLEFHATKDLQVRYDAGVKNGDGTEEQRCVVRDFIESFDLFHDQIIRAQCRMSWNVEFTYYADCGHDLPIRRPGVVVEEVKKLLERVKADRK
jgi:pimeloyl-ACP methyl ester carboxylesterase